MKEESSANVDSELLKIRDILGYLFAYEFEILLARLSFV